MLFLLVELKRYMMSSADISKRVVIHQPDFMPYPGFFHRLLDADRFVVLDHVQFLRNSKSWHHRDLIKTPQGSAWLTISVKKAPRYTAIKDIELSEEVDWRRRHLNLIQHHYRKAPFFDEIYPRIYELYQQPCGKLVDFNLAAIDMLVDLFGLQVDMRLSSKMQPVGKGCDLLVDLVQKSKSTHYLSGVGARDYYQPEPFNAAGIEVRWQRYKPVVYAQRYANFIPNLSSIDMLLNCGIRASRRLLRTSFEEEPRS